MFRTVRPVVAELNGMCRPNSNLVNNRRHYPLCRLETDISKEELPTDLPRGLAGVVAKSFNKLEQVRSEHNAKLVKHLQHIADFHNVASLTEHGCEHSQ